MFCLCFFVWKMPTSQDLNSNWYIKLLAQIQAQNKSPRSISYLWLILLLSVPFKEVAMDVHPLSNSNCLSVATGELQQLVYQRYGNFHCFLITAFQSGQLTVFPHIMLIPHSYFYVSVYAPPTWNVLLPSLCLTSQLHWYYFFSTIPQYLYAAHIGRFLKEGMGAFNYTMGSRADFLISPP